jgi:hypothetical protein
MNDSAFKSPGGLIGFLIAIFLFLACGCASYTTPGPGAELAALVPPEARGLTEPDIQKLLERKPVAVFPARLAVVRIQAANYLSHGAHSVGTGRYSVVTTREVEREEHFNRLGALPMVAGVAPLNRILLPFRLETDKELRMAAASLQADLLLIYTLGVSCERDCAAASFSVLSLDPAKRGSRRYLDGVSRDVRCQNRLCLWTR